jgi:hypothetical protein
VGNARADIIGLSDYVYQRTRSRLAGLTGTYGGKRNPQWLGVERPPAGFEWDDPAPATAVEAIAALARAHAFWQDVLEELPAASWWEPLGPIAGPYAEDDKASLVLHQLDEQIHHGAELGTLRDLYLHSQAGVTPGPSV